MNKKFKKLSVLLMVLLLVFGSSAMAMADNSGVTYHTGDMQLSIDSANTAYTSTDLFDNFKNVMPGDVLWQDIEITLENGVWSADKVEILMRAVAHDAGNPLTMNDLDADPAETVETMTQFLQQMKMTIWNGNVPIYQGTADGSGETVGISPDQLDGLATDVSLGTYRLSSQGPITLKVRLEVPVTMGNDFAAREGEVDWVFTAISSDDPYNPPVNPTPTSASVTLYAAKTLNGERPTGSEYSFVLKDSSGNIVQTVANSGGNIVFDTMRFAKAGTYVYTIEEVNGGAEGVTYDGSVYTAEITVTEDAAGNCSASVAYLKDGVSYSGTMVFANKAETDVPDPDVPKGDVETPDDPDEPIIDIEDGDVPKGDKDGASGKPKTGDTAVIWPYAALMGVSAAMMVLLAVKRRRSQQ